MAHRCCPVADCTNAVPPGGIVCVDCYFLMERLEFSLLFRTRLAAQRAVDAAARKHLQEQFEAYLRSAVKRIAEKRANG